MEWLTNPEIWVACFTLTALEIVLGIDNIIMISILVSRMPKHMQARTRIFGLALAMIHVIIEEGLTDRDYIERHTLGYADLAEHVDASERSDPGAELRRYHQQIHASDTALALPAAEVRASSGPPHRAPYADGHDVAAPGSPVSTTVIQAALSRVGSPYSWVFHRPPPRSPRP